jgi:glycosyltransferase involved in cell wall biosynthesis
MSYARVASSEQRLRVAHVITDLQTGGAEMMLLRLCERIDRARVEPRVISLKQTHPVGDRIAALGVPVVGLGIGAAPTPRDFFRLSTMLRGADVVQTWMIHADLVGGIAALLAGRLPVAWGIHVGKLDRATHGTQALVVARLNALLSRVLPRVVVSCSETSKREVVALGFPADRVVVIPNGFDLERFRPDPEARRAIRRELAIPDDAPVVGQLSRFHPQKDQPTLLAAAARALDRLPSAHLVLCGRGLADDNAALMALVADWPASRRARLHLLGERGDAARVVAAFDVLCSSSSYGEAFPLVLGEAMCAEVSCVATDCGDSALLIGDTGRVVPIRAPAALADAIVALLSLPADERRRLGAAARARIAAHYDLSAIASRYESLWRSIVSAI